MALDSWKKFLKEEPKKPLKPFDYMGESKKRSLRDKATDDYACGGAVRDIMGRAR